jgi:hypothetical protein
MGWIDRPVIFDPVRAGWPLNRDVGAEPLQFEGKNGCEKHI